MTEVLAVDLGGTHLRVALVDRDGALSEHRSIATPVTDPTPKALVALARELADRATHAVIGVPGRVNHEQGRLEWAPHLPPAWVQWITEAHLAEGIGIPVSLANDADLAACGEARFGAGRHDDDVVYVTISTGIGAGVVLGGRVLHGHRSMVEIGHSVIDLPAYRRGEPCTWDALGSGTGMGARAAARGLAASGAALQELVDSGDPRALEVWETAVSAAEAGICALAQLFSPEVVVVGGGVGLLGEKLLGPVRRALVAHGPQDLANPIRLVNADLGDDAGLAGAGAWDTMFQPEQRKNGG
ncbi:MAG: ROK family protein [Candidatus Dormibacteria bacterium]